MKIEDLYKIYLSNPKVTTDSRNCGPGSLFFALKGPSFDGNKFALQTLEKGAAYAIVDDIQLQEHPRLIKVPDVLKTLQDLALFHRTKLGIPVIAITGTNGKTTTKELVASVLAEKYKISYTQGNLNNHIGVPLTLLSIPNETELAIIEMGANHPGEIKALCQIADPDFGLITNVGKAHLEGFGSFEGVIQTKTELYRFLAKKEGLVFLNLSNPLLFKEAIKTTTRKIGYGEHPNSSAFGILSKAAPFLELQWQIEGKSTLEAKTKLVGRYNLENMLAAIAVGHFFEVSLPLINEALEGYTPSNNRSQLSQTDHNRLIMDFYNANPTSMQVALDNFISLPSKPKAAILGDMRELGTYSHEEHQKVIEYLEKAPLEQVYLVGPEFMKLQMESDRLQFFPTSEDLKEVLAKKRLENFTILLKGSRGIALEKVLQVL